jgi:hypothetical protein
MPTVALSTNAKRGKRKIDVWYLPLFARAERGIRG